MAERGSTRIHRGRGLGSLGLLRLRRAVRCERRSGWPAARHGERSGSRGRHGAGVVIARADSWSAQVARAMDLAVLVHDADFAVLPMPVPAAQVGVAHEVAPVFIVAEQSGGALVLAPGPVQGPRRLGRGPDVGGGCLPGQIARTVPGRNRIRGRLRSGSGRRRLDSRGGPGLGPSLQILIGVSIGSRQLGFAPRRFPRGCLIEALGLARMRKTDDDRAREQDAHHGSRRSAEFRPGRVARLFPRH
jgi:hypothetical protein